MNYTERVQPHKDIHHFVAADVIPTADFIGCEYI